MKHLLILLFFLPLFSYCQDIIYQLDGKELSTKVIEITPEVIKYKLFTQQDGPVRNIFVKDVLKIKYADGFLEVFSGKAEEKTDTPAQPVTEIKNETPIITEPEIKNEPPSTKTDNNTINDQQAPVSTTETNKSTVPDIKSETATSVTTPIENNETISTKPKTEEPITTKPVSETPADTYVAPVTVTTTQERTPYVQADKYEKEFDLGLIFGRTSHGSKAARNIYRKSIAFNMPFIWWNKKNGNGFELSTPILDWGTPDMDFSQDQAYNIQESRCRISVVSLTYNSLYRLKLGRSYIHNAFFGVGLGMSYFNETINADWEYLDEYGYSYSNNIHYNYSKFPFTMTYVIGYRLSVLNVSIQYSLIQVKSAREKNKTLNVGGLTYSIGFRF